MERENGRSEEETENVKENEFQTSPVVTSKYFFDIMEFSQKNFFRNFAQ